MKQILDFNSLGNKIRAVREGRGYTQTDLADSVELTQPGIGKIESGKSKVELENLFKIANALDCSVAYLLGVDDSDLSDAETDLLYIYRRVPAHLQETALDLLRVLIQVPAPAEILADPPPSTEIAEAIGNLDQQQQEQVLDFVDFLTEPRIQQILHQKQRRRDIQRSIDIIDLYLAVCEATPAERERLITDLLFQLQGG